MLSDDSEARNVEPRTRSRDRFHHFVGIKAHRHDAPLTREICEAARAFSLPVMYDVMGEVSVVELLAEEYPDVPFIIPHLGSFSDDWRAQLDLIDHLVRRPNVHADTSGVRRFDLLEQAVRRAGARKILFGSDGPWSHPGVETDSQRENMSQLFFYGSIGVSGRLAILTYHRVSG